MKIQPLELTVRELTKGYEDKQEDGVRGYEGKLDIRPPYQREFIYKDKQRDAVINTVRQDYPLNVMYWSAREDGGFEIIDGQQRTVSIAKQLLKIARCFAKSTTERNQENKNDENETAKTGKRTVSGHWL